MSITVAQLVVKIGADITEATKGIDGVGAKMQSMGGQMVASGAMLTAGITAPLVLIGKSAVKSSADFETSMNVLAESSGASADEVAMLSTKAKALGADLTLPGTSASDAAQAMLELSKAGLSVNHVMDASKGVLQLSAAGQISNAEAAQVTANALNMFGLSGGDAVMVADLLAAAANGSSASVQEMAMALSMGGSAAQQYGVDIDDFTTELALMANAGIKGSDAGTSLKTMFSRLGAPTDEAKKALKDLRIEIYDGSGKMRSQRDLIADFSNKLGGMTQESRNAAIQTIFGADAMRAANIVLAGGVEAYDQMNKKVNEAGAAAGLAGAMMKGMGGALAQMQSAASDASLALGKALAPTVVSVANSITKLTQSFTALTPEMQTNIVKMALFAAAIGPVTTILGGVTSGVGTTITVFNAVWKAASTAAVGLKAYQAGMTLVTSLGAAGLSPAAIAFGAIALAVTATAAAIAGLVLANNALESETERMAGGIVKAGDAAIKAGDSYEVYKQKMEAAAKANSMLYDEQGNLIRRVSDLGNGYNATKDVVVAANAMMSASQYKLRDALLISAAAYDAEATARLADNVAVVDSVAAAAAAQKATEDLASANEKAAQSMGDAKVAQLNLSESLKGASAPQAMKVVIDGLKKSISETGDASGVLGAQVEALDLKYGFATVASQNLAVAMKGLEIGMQTGLLPAYTSMDSAQIGLTDKLARGKITFEDYLKAMKVAPADAAAFIATLDTTKTSAQGVVDPASKAQEAINKIKTGIESITPESIKGFTTAMGTLGQDMAGAASAGATSLGDAMAKIKDGLEAITGEKIKAISNELGPLGEAMGEVFTKGAGPLAQAMATIKAGLAVLTADAVVPVVAGLKALSTGMTEALGVGVTGADTGGVSAIGAEASGATKGVVPVVGPVSAAGGSDATKAAAGAVPQQEAQGGIAGMAAALGMIKSNLEGIVVAADKVSKSLPTLGLAVDAFVKSNLEPFNTKLDQTLNTYMIKIDDLINKMTLTDIPALIEIINKLTSPTLSDLTKAMDSMKLSTIPGLQTAFSRLAASIQEAINKARELKDLLGSIPGGLGGGGGSSGGAPRPERQFGGQVLSGTPYIVGERGPELFVPSRNGMITSNNSMGGGGKTIVINNNFSDTSMDDDNFMRCLLRAERMGTI
jgi:TP901 family phage tail tape measure protein